MLLLGLRSHLYLGKNAEIILGKEHFLNPDTCIYTKCDRYRSYTQEEQPDSSNLWTPIIIRHCNDKTVSRTEISQMRFLTEIKKRVYKVMSVQEENL
jgi:hypothetical protein